MAVYARVAHSGPNTNDGNRLIVRYDEERGWVACNSPWGAGSFAIDKLAPPTYAEVVNVLFNHNSRRRNNYIQIQFRSRAVKPKGATATEATKNTISGRIKRSGVPFPSATNARRSIRPHN